MKKTVLFALSMMGTLSCATEGRLPGMPPAPSPMSSPSVALPIAAASSSPAADGGIAGQKAASE